MQMSTDQVSKYTQFAHHVRTAIPMMIGQRKIVDGIMNHSGADEATVKKGLIWGTGPTVNVALLVPQERDGKTYYPTGGYRLGSNIIDISMGDVGRFQTDQDMRTTARGQVHLITIILLHELTHWAREKSGTSDSPDVEDGFEFEKEVYGKVFER
jgi:hypothetical protein